MKSLNFRTLARATGGTDEELARTLKVEPSRIRLWMEGVEVAPESATDLLMTLVNSLLARAEETTRSINVETPGKTPKLPVSTTKRQAFVNGFPFAGCEEVAAGLVQSRCHYRIDVVPSEALPDKSLSSNGENGPYEQKQRNPQSGAFIGTLAGFVTLKNRPALLLDMDENVRMNIRTCRIPCLIEEKLAFFIGSNNALSEAWSRDRISVDGTIYYRRDGEPDHIVANSLKSVTSHKRQTS